MALDKDTIVKFTPDDKWYATYTNITDGVKIGIPIRKRIIGWALCKDGSVRGVYPDGDGFGTTFADLPTNFETYVNVKDWMEYRQEYGD